MPRVGAEVLVLALKIRTGRHRKLHEVWFRELFGQSLPKFVDGVSTLDAIVGLGFDLRQYAVPQFGFGHLNPATQDKRRPGAHEIFCGLRDVFRRIENRRKIDNVSDGIKHLPCKPERIDDEVRYPDFVVTVRPCHVEQVVESFVILMLVVKFLHLLADKGQNLALDARCGFFDLLRFDLCLEASLGSAAKQQVDVIVLEIVVEEAKNGLDILLFLRIIDD